MNEINTMITDGVLVTAGTLDNFETSPIYWGMAGTMFRKKSFTFFIRPNSLSVRHLLEQSQFTVSFYYPRYRQHLSYLSTESQNTLQSIKDINFHPVQVEGSVTFKEAYHTYVCKKVAAQEVDTDSIEESYRNIYFKNDASIMMFVGEVVQEIEDESLDKE